MESSPRLTHPLAISVASQPDQAIVTEILEDTRSWLHAKGIKQWPFPFTSEWVNRCLEKQEFFLANVDQVTVGVFRLFSSDPSIWGENADDAMYIHTLAVRRSWQGHGIGRDLLAWAEDYTVQNHRPYLRLDCLAENSVLCQYYEQAGFMACGVKEFQVREFFYKAQLFQKAVRPYTAA
jgi:GNAT superfamily N-acetyltransferase